MTRTATSWEQLVGMADVIEGAMLRGIETTKVENRSAGNDVLLCDPDDVPRRIKTIQAARNTTPERVFMARALSEDAVTAAAMLTRACIARWTESRGRRSVHDQHEKWTLDLAERHLTKQGHHIGSDVMEARNHLPASAVRPPICHEGEADVVTKAIGQIVKYIGGRHVIVMTQD